VLDQACKRGIVLDVQPSQVARLRTEEYPLPARRPRNSRLNLAKLEKVFNLKMPPWQQGVQRMLDEIQL
jgi:dTDP-4-dehydrorhamnose reductase